MSTTLDVSRPRLMRLQLDMLSLHAKDLCDAPVSIHRWLSSLTGSDVADGKSDEMLLAISGFCGLGDGLRYVAEKLKQFEGFLNRVYDNPLQVVSEAGETKRTAHELAFRLADSFYLSTWAQVDIDEAETALADDWPAPFDSASLTAETPVATSRRVAFVQAVQQWTPYDGKRLAAIIEGERDRVYGMIDKTQPRDPLAGLAFLLNADDWKKLSQEQRDLFTGYMSPDDIEKDSLYTWGTLKPMIDRGEIRAAKFKSRQYRIVKSDLEAVAKRQ